MTAPKKQNLIKIVIGLIVAAVSGGAADAAGYMPDLAAIENLGVLGSVLLIAYFEYRAMPVLLRIAKLDPAAATAPASEQGVEVEVLVEEKPAAPSRRVTQPHLVAIPPAKDPR